MKHNYRIVKDNYLGFEAQVKYWWFPFIWFQIWGSHGPANTSSSIENAKDICLKHGRPKVYWSGKVEDL